MLARANPIVLFAAAALDVGACDIDAGVSGRAETASKAIVIYNNDTIPANLAIWNQRGIFVDGFRYANVCVEFEQKKADEHPLSVGVGFAPMESGRLGTRSVYDFSDGSVADSVLGPYMWVYPLNAHDQPRRFSIVVYLTR